MAQLSFHFMQYNQKTQRGIIKISHTGLDALKAALVFVTHVGGEPAIVRSIVASGSLKKIVPYLNGGN